MAANQPPRRPSWRDKGESSSASSSPAKGGRAWQAHKATSAPVKKHGSRRTWLFLATAVFLGLTGTLIWVATLIRPPRPASLVLLGASYDDNLTLPHNLQGWQSLDDLTQLANRPETKSWLSFLGSGAIHLLPRENAQVTETGWKKGWEDFKEQTVIVFVSLHGGADGKGPFLFLDDRTAKKTLRMDQIQDHLEAGKLRGKNKLLILDATQIQADWQRGMLNNDFVRQLKDLQGRRTGDGSAGNLFIMVASDEGQRSWVSEDWQQTIFAHYVIEGLKGAADANNDSRVTAGELHHYVHEHVKQWVRDNRDADQDSVFLGDSKAAENIELVKIESAYQEPSVDEARGKNANWDGLEDAWKHCEELRARTPSPAVYTPYIWRQYQDTLLRYEQLIRAGDPTKKAGNLKDGLYALENEIAKAQRLTLVSSGNALPLADAYGQGSPGLETELRSLQVDELWKNTIPKDKSDKAQDKAKKSTTWDEVKKKIQTKDEAEKRLIRVGLMSQMFADLLERPAAENIPLETGRQALDFLADDGHLRPIEAHYLTMLERDLPTPNPDPKFVRLALQTRLLAERAALGLVVSGDPGFQQRLEKQPASEEGTKRHPYSEAIFPWIRKQVDAGDKERWKGENQLFASAPQYWKEAETHFLAAKGFYEKALADAAVLQAAYQARDAVFANVPYLSLWLAQQRVMNDAEAVNIDALVTTAEEVWKGAHTLASDLSKLNADGLAAAFPPDKRSSLAEQTADLAKNYQALQEEFNRRCEKLTDARTQRELQQADDALAVPFIPTVRRLSFLRNIRANAARLNQSQAKKETSVPLLKSTDEMHRAGIRQGRLAVALLGEPWLTEIEQNKLLNLVNQPESAQTSQVLTEAGSRLEAQYDRLRDETTKLVQAANANPNLDEALTQATLADRHARLLDGGAAALVNNKPYGPGDARHRLELHNLLAWQINRTVDDHWFADSQAPEAKPYYLVAAELFLQDAGVLARVQDDAIDKERLATLDKLKKERCKRSGLTVRLGEKSPVFMTSTSKTLAWNIIGDPGLPPGEPVFWLKLDGKIKTQGPVDVHSRKPLSLGQDKALSFPLESPLQADQIEASASRKPLEGTATLQGRYRGQILENRADTRIQLIPDTVVLRYPESNVAGIAVRAAEDVQQGVLSVVMDASGSMGIDDGKAWSRDKPCKYHDATKALRGVLRKLPRGARVNIWVLGGGYDRETRLAFIRPLRDEPIVWNPDNPRQLENVIDEVEDIKPEGGSPIADTMVRALKKDLLPGVGIKTLLVLTDGDDNESKEKNNIPDYLQREFAGKQVFINMVFFQISAEEKARADKQFGKLDELFPGRGRIWFEKEAKELPGRLEEALIPKVRVLQNGRAVAGAPPQGYRVSFEEDKDLRWSGELKPSTYEAFVYNIFKQDFGLTAGDRLLMLLHRKDNRITYERALFAREGSNRSRPRVEKDDWLAAVLQNGHFATDGSLRLLLTLEDLRNRHPQEGDLLKQSKPGFRWIEVKPRNGGDRSGLRWANDERYPAPAWKITRSDWPVREDNKPEPAEVEVWWSGEPFPPKDGGLDHAPDKQRETVRVEDQTITVESVFVPEQKVTIAPNSTAKKPCLILRITHDPKKPIWARLNNHTGGEEHDFFRDPGQYTAIFWGVDETKAKKFTVDFTSLEKFKHEARNHVLFENLPAPISGDQGPDLVPLDKSGN